jgi:ATP-dependent DNA helicase 2 subunit 2
MELPFEDDMRRYEFPSLDRKLAVSGKVITEHKDLTADLTAAKDAYVDAMDLLAYGED